MDLLLNNVLNLTKEEIQNSKIENLICRPVVAGSRSLTDGSNTVRLKRCPALVPIVLIGDGMENSVIFIRDSGYLVLHE